jgi:hypothetical protein
MLPVVPSSSPAGCNAKGSPTRWSRQARKFIRSAEMNNDTAAILVVAVLGTGVGVGLERCGIVAPAETGERSGRRMGRGGLPGYPVSAPDRDSNRARSIESWQRENGSGIAGAGLAFTAARRNGAHPDPHSEGPRVTRDTDRAPAGVTVASVRRQYRRPDRSQAEAQPTGGCLGL